MSAVRIAKRKTESGARRRVAKRKAEHRCVRCGRPAIEGHTSCELCTERGRHRGGIRKHIRSWEKAHGKKLPRGWVVHHLNGKHGDDRPQNLLAIPKKSHKTSLLLSALRKRILQLEAKLKEGNKQIELPIKES